MSGYLPLLRKYQLLLCQWPMMSKLGAMFVLLLLFTLASSQEKGDVQAGKTQKSDFYRTLTRSARGCTMSCAFQNNICQGTCHCSGSTNCYCASGP
uniref:Conotoxin Superfamily S n=1 Tax=Conus episcopatus TaxID=88764 RepID=A0A0K2S6Z5_CONEP|nr:Conotoxin Superfamily S [Conus episcopatus]